MRKKISLTPILQWLILLGFTFFTNTLVLAQKEHIVKGKVSDANGPLVGATISEKGGKATTMSDASGVFEIPVSGSAATLVVSYVGYNNSEIKVKGQTFINAVLESTNANTLSGVVVTALGITRTKKSLGYDVGQISGEDMNRVTQTNVLNAMAGKVSGVTVSSTGASPTSSVSVVIRGTRSLNSDNQPLFVIDGVPVKNSLSNIGTNTGNSNDVDYGNTISDLNPNDIENVSVLKGPSAAALYGSRAGNGVILITTKSGKKQKGSGVTFSSATEVATPYHYLPLNQSYTIGTDPYTEPNGFNSWNGVLVDMAGTDTYRFGTPLNKGLKAIQWNSPKDASGNYIPLPMVSHNNLQNFVETGITSTNSLSVENATDKDNYRFSYSNTTNKGIIPTTGVVKHNLSLNVEHKISNALKISSVINYGRSSSDNVVAGNDGVLKYVAYLSPSVDIRDMKNFWLTPGIQQRKVLPPVGVDQSPDVLDPADNGDDNPYFYLHQVKNSFVRNHLFGNVKLSYQLNPHISTFVRYSQDMFYENRETKISKSFNDEINGYYSLTNIYNTESNTDFLATYTNTFQNKFDLSTSVGGNILYTYGSNLLTNSAHGGGIIAPEYFNVSNISQTNIRYGSGYSQKAVYSAYATASLGYKSMAYLDLTGRNDWSSTLPAGQNSYFYPSASLSLLLNKMFNMGNSISLFKIRGGWASVGKDTDPYNLYGTVGVGSFGGIITQGTSSTLKNPNLKPEKAVSTELGLELNLYKNRLRFEGTVYRSDNSNQVLSISTPGSSGYSGRQINAGLVRSQGIELRLAGTIIANKDWTWDMAVNYTKNDAYVMSLANGVNYFSFWQDGRSGSWTYAKGQPIPNMFDANGKQVISDGKLGQLWDNQLATVTDKTSKYYGWPLLDNDGFIQTVGNGDFQHKTVVGNFNPKLLLGIQTSVSWKSLTLSASIDTRWGGTFFSQTYRYLGSDAAMARQENMGIPIPASAKGDIPGYLKANPGANIIVSGNLAQFHLVGGPTTELGGFPFTNNGITINDGAFYPGVYEDGNGGYIENLGDPATTKYDIYEDAVTGGWNFARMSMFDASYIKLRELTLTTQLPKRWSDALKLQGISLGVYTRNIIIWTKAKAGVDPEMAYQFQKGRQGNGSQFRQGIERYNITPWTIPVGVKLSVHF
ncbi:MAG: SusC/RagA family TonB-linked outer membrane protein [Ferruginibacter sp.]|uniref:SusC/RagA family TonB-linked outer membrane protein n=1 Tax=Ferruginibacter sp. TaxID=1940288 RepID=UPI00265B2717|nr:SusC/RagA family TonB-linked outer membrane protein [Ferruginibacter sp.]MDB5276795.1 SusC/RagA family TonB-linked outer membrane protein [Ferruginibacter sp.]